MSPDAAGGHRQLVLGFLAAIAMVAVWGSWSALTRLGTFTLDLPTLLLMRFAIPPLVLFPVIWRTGLFPKGVSRRLLFVMVFTGGFGFFICAALALRLAPVAEAGPLLPGAPPLFLALWAVLWEKRRFSAAQSLGYVLIGVGIFAITFYPALRHGELNAGHFLALAAGAVWAVYTVAYGRSGLTSVEAAAVIPAWTTLLALPFCIVPLMASWNAGLGGTILVQGLVQGVGSGVVALVLFGIAVRYIGIARTSAMAAISPVLATSLAIPLLGEWPTPGAVLAIVTITGGVILANLPSRTPE